MRRWLIVAWVVAAAVGINAAAYQKEARLVSGEQIFLPLAPVDPRSLMQGDYMALRFVLAEAVTSDAMSGAVVVTLDARRVATFARLDDGAKLGPDERRVRYTSRGGRPVFGADAFFFEEGRAKAFEAARFGGMRVDDAGQLMLESMHDEALRRIE